MRKYKNDQRTEEEIQSQKKVIQAFSQRNFKNFQDQINKQKQQQPQNLSQQYQKPIKHLLSENRFVNITDNLQHENQQFQTKFVIFAIHGIPGSYLDFKMLEESFPQNYCRWINFCVPGLDQLDERRGSFDSNMESTFQLIYDLLQSLKISKIVVMVHSFGGAIGKTFASRFPEKVSAIIQLASVPLLEWTAYQQFSEYLKLLLKDIYDKISFESLSKDEFRQQITQRHSKFKEKISKLPKDQQKAYILLTQLSPFDIFVFLKYELETVDKAIEYMKNIDPKIPRFFAYNDKDLFISPEIIEEEIFKVLKTSQYSIKQNPLGIQLDLENAQSNFVFQFTNATHNVQRTKPQELSALIQAFFNIIDSENQKNNIIQSKL